jgi:hypothetical protein
MITSIYIHLSNTRQSAAGASAVVSVGRVWHRRNPRMVLVVAVVGFGDGSVPVAVPREELVAAQTEEPREEGRRCFSVLREGG